VNQRRRASVDAVASAGRVCGGGVGSGGGEGATVAEARVWRMRKLDSNVWLKGARSALCVMTGRGGGSVRSCSSKLLK
jgi:hypothetical protein